MKERNVVTPIFAVLLLAISQAGHAAVIGYDDFDGAGSYLSRNVTPDNSANSPAGTFPGSALDVFGIVDRNVNRDFQDDTLSGITDATRGLTGSTKTDRFFGIEDLDNTDNPLGTGSVTWTFDIAGFAGLTFSVELAALGDFEDSDAFAFSADIDGGGFTPLVDIIADLSASQTYVYDDGSVESFDDPLSAGGLLLNNVFTAFSTAVNGTGNILTLRMTARQNAGLELFAFDNLVVEGTSASPAVPLPATFILFGIGVVSLGLRLSRPLDVA